MDESLSKYRSTTRWVLHGTIIAAVCLLALLVAHDVIAHSAWVKQHVGALLFVGVYLTVAEALCKIGRYSTVNWLIVLLYEIVALIILLTWGLNAPVGILTICFTVLLPSILMKPRVVFLITAFSGLALVAVQLYHANRLFASGSTMFSQPSSFWDVLVYSTILAIFALASWLSGSQREKTLDRALLAEKKLQAQRDTLRRELAKESATLRQTQLKQIRELHQFALMGQSTAATLHELSTHLSVLNLDIDDLNQQHASSQAIGNAKDSIAHINKMVRQAKHQLDTYGDYKTFNVHTVINRCVQDMQEKFARRNVTLVNEARLVNTTTLKGSPLALMQVLTILLNNALEACCTTQNGEVRVTINITDNHFVVSIIDNGPGIESSIRRSLFKPLLSSKPSGMGIGLYIARHLTKNHFNGLLESKPTRSGAHFSMTFPYEATV